MYKDVWKRFGTKILIVFCSVLLLGGAAIAVPKLMAYEKTQISLSTVKSNFGDGDASGFVPISGASLTVSGIGSYTGNDQKDSLNYSIAFDDGSEWMFGKRDANTKVFAYDEATGQIGAEATLCDAGVYILNVTASSTSDYLKQDGSMRQIKYTIEPAPLPPRKVSGNVDDNTNVIMIDSQTATLNPSIIKIVLNPNSGNPTTLTTGYSIPNNIQLTVGQNAIVPITFTNYYESKSGGVYNKTVNETFAVKQNIASVASESDIVLMKDGKPFTPTSIGDRPDSVEINANGVALTQGTDFTVEYKQDETKNELNVIVIGINNYAGKITKPYTVSTADFQIKEVVSDSPKTGSVYEYIESSSGASGHGYVINVQKFIVDDNGGNDGNGTPLIPDSNCKIVRTCIVEGNGSTTPVLGQTAGVVMMEVEGTAGTYAGRKGYCYYAVRRDIKNVKREEITPRDRLTFDGSESCETPKLSVTDENGEIYELEAGTDYKVEYFLSKRGASAGTSLVTEKDGAKKDAGTVYMKVTGIVNAGTGGYYGTMDPTPGNPDAMAYWATLSYEKKPKTVSASDAHINLTQDMFNRSCSAADIKAVMSIVTANNAPLIWGDNLDKECTIRFLKPDGNPVEWGNLTASPANTKDYTVECELKGNYEGTLTAKFGIADYKEPGITITYEPCSQDGSTGLSNHVYTGVAHDLKPIIYSEDEKRTLEEGKDYGLDWENNVDASTGTTKAVLIIRFSKDNTIRKEFEISPRQIKNDSDNYVEFISPFTGDHGNGFYHEYCGQVLADQPKPNKIRYRFLANGKPVTRELTVGVDFEYPTDGWLCSDASGAAVLESDRIKVGEKYYYKIIPKGNYQSASPSFGGATKPVVVGPFEYSRRDISVSNNRVELTANNTLPYATAQNNTLLEQWLNDAANLTVMDNGLQTPAKMVFGGTDADYSIDTSTVNKDGISKNGTIKITLQGQGNYKGSLAVEVNVGTNLANTRIEEPRKENGGHNTISFSNSTAILKESYGRTNDNNDPYDLKLGQSAGVNLVDPQKLSIQDPNNPGIGQYYIVGSVIHPDYDAGITHASIKLQGVNGYFGEVTIQIPVSEIIFGDLDYKIEFDYEWNPKVSAPTYTGAPLEPSFRVRHKVVDSSGNETWETIDSKNYDIHWATDEGMRNINANEDHPNDSDKMEHWGKVKVTGKNGYGGFIEGYFKILKRNISNTNNGLNHTNFSFTEGTSQSNLKAMSYIPYTKDYQQYVDSTELVQKTGPWQTVTLYFFTGNATSGKALTSNDYEYYCTGTKPTIQADGSITGNQTKPKAESSWAVITGKGNFKGTVLAKYDVSRVALKEEMFDVRFENAGKWMQFTGDVRKPEIKVFQKENANDAAGEYELTAGTDYVVEYGSGNVFVSKNYMNPGQNLTFVRIKQIASDDRNYTGEFTVPYVIYGELTNNETANARLYYTNRDDKTNRLKILYDADRSVMYGNLGLVFQQRGTGKNYPTDGVANGTDNDQYPMTLLKAPATAETSDYTVREGSQSSIGYGQITIDGTSDRKSSGLIAGSATVDVLVWANLNSVTDDSEGLWSRNGGSSNITVTGSAFTVDDLADALQKALYIYCGGRELKYGEDYVFDSKFLTTEIGTEKPLKILPSDKAKDEGYLDGETIIHFNLTSSLSDVVVNAPIESQYIYAHGQTLVNSQGDFKLTLNGKELINGQHYTVTIKNENNEVVTAATDRGKYSYLIEGKGQYSGRLPQGEFEILPYNLTVNKDKVEVRLKKKTVTYTSKPVFPEIDDVVIFLNNNVEKSLKDPNFNGGKNYVVKPGGGGNNTNWTNLDAGDEQPIMRIEGIGNYEGYVEEAYLIEQKDIGSADITVEDILGLKYNNNQPIKPYPDIRYTERLANPDGGEDIINILLSLRGEEYNADKANSYNNWIQDGIHFTYQYLDDVHTAGTGKRITIRGVGNFKGSREKTYDVSRLSLSDTKLTFLSEESPVYDGTKQTPAFKLSYEGIDILTYMNGTTSSNYLSSSNVVCEFKDNENASTDNLKASVTVRIAGDNDNYEGETTAYFTILPAPLDNHVRFMYRPAGTNGDVDLSNYKLNLPFKGVGSPVYPGYADTDRELADGEIGMYYDYPQKANNGKFLIPGGDYYNNLEADENGFKIEYKYVEPDTDDTDIREEYRRDTPDYAGKVKVTITGRGNYAGSASYWYFIGEDISTDAKISISPTTAVFNAQKQYPEVKISGVDKEKCKIGRYRNEVAVENLISPDDFINAATYYIRVEGDPTKGTYATKPETLTYTITPRAFSNNLVIDGFKREYSYTGYDICPVGISVTDYIDKIKYKLTEDVDYTLTYTNNLNAGTAYINIKGQNNFSGSATANFMITSSTISSGGWGGNNSFLDQGTGEISGSTAVSPNEVNMSMDTIDAMYYTGRPVYPKVSIAGMTENIDYTVTFSNNVEVGTAVATVNGIGNNKGTITKNFRIIAQLSKCTISPIPAQQYTGSEVKPALTVKCGNSILMEGTDYTVTYSNNINIGTATATLRALNNANYTGTASVKFSIGNDVGGFIISGYAPSYAYTGKAITPGVVVETGSRTLVPGTEYTVSYSNNVNAGTATITVTGVGKYSGKQTANFVIEPKSIQSCDTTDIADRTYTGDAYTPSVTVSDGGKVLTKGVDYTVTYTNNINPGTATVVIRGLSSNYAGTKVISFKISAVAVKGLKATNVKYNSMKLKWTKQGYADGYQLCDSKSKVIKTLKKNSVTITGLTAGKTYKYKVRSYIRNADGTKSYGAFSSVLNATTKLRTPTVKVVSNAKGQARISWSKVSGASGYEIYYKKTSSAKYKKLKTVNSPNIRVCTVRGMKSGDRAYFRIRAFRKNGSKKVYSSLNPLKVITVK